MAVTLETAARNASVNGVVDLLDSGSVEIKTSGDTLLATLTLANPAFGSAVNGSAAIPASVQGTVVADGEASKAVWKASGGSAVFTTSVGISSADIIASGVTFSVDDQVVLQTFTLTQPAS